MSLRDICILQNIHLAFSVNCKLQKASVNTGQSGVRFSPTIKPHCLVFSRVSYEIFITMSLKRLLKVFYTWSRHWSLEAEDNTKVQFQWWLLKMLAPKKSLDPIDPLISLLVIILDIIAPFCKIWRLIVEKMKRKDDNVHKLQLWASDRDVTPRYVHPSLYTVVCTHIRFFIRFAGEGVTPVGLFSCTRIPPNSGEWDMLHFSISLLIK